MGFIFVKGAVNQLEEYNTKISPYEKTLYDFIVYDPIESQVGEIKANQYVENVFEYYSYNADITFNGNTYDTKALFSSNESGLVISAFNENRILDGEYKIEEGDIFVDEIVADNLNAKVGDEITLSFNKVSNIHFTIKAIFESNNFYDNGSVYFSYVGTVKDNIDSQREVELSNILIDAKDNLNCYEYLKDYYVPYGRMLTRDYFSSDLEYNDYVNTFKNADYSSEIYNKESVLNSIQTNNKYLVDDASSNVKLGAIIAAVILLLLCLIPVFGKIYETNYEKRTKSTIPNKNYKLGINIINLFAYIISFVIVLGITIVLQNNANLYSNVLSNVLTFVGISFIISFAVITIISNIIIVKINNKKC